MIYQKRLFPICENFKKCLAGSQRTSNIQKLLMLHKRRIFNFRVNIKAKISQGRFDNTSKAVRAGLRLLEVEETKLEALRTRLAEGEAQLDKGQGVDGQSFMDKLIG